VPVPVFFLALAVFAMGTSEFMLAGLVPEIAGALGVSLAQAGLLTSAFAAGLVVGAPLMAAVARSWWRRFSFSLWDSGWARGAGLGRGPGGDGPRPRCGTEVALVTAVLNVGPAAGPVLGTVAAPVRMAVVLIAAALVPSQVVALMCRTASAPSRISGVSGK
jgi:predicted MFS family arabinose efflux permease